MLNKELDIQLRPTVLKDLPVLFQFQLDEKAAYLAAFMPANWTDEAAYITKYTRLLQDTTVNNQTLFLEDTIVGSIAKFKIENTTEITYWIDSKFWGRGVATNALNQFLALETIRPIFARVAFDNIGSQRVLEKCGFKQIGKDQGFANARGIEIEEYVYKLL